MRLTREDYRHLAMILVLWGALGGLFGFVACRIAAAVNTPAVQPQEQVEPPPPTAPAN